MNMNEIKHALFYRSENHDRVYGADSMEYLLKKFFTTGVFVEEFMVTANGGMSVKLGAGYVNIGGKVKVYLDDQELFLETAHATYDRIDSIVLERNDSDRDIFVKVVKGGYSTNPTPLVPVRENGVDQRVVAQIYVAHGAVKITQADITDTRTDTFLCGMVAGTVKEMDFSQFTAQFEAFFAEYRENISEKFEEFLENADDYSDQFVAWVVAKKAEITNWQSKEAEDFDAWVQEFVNRWESWLLGETKGWQEEIIDWFDNLKEKLSENAAVQLQLQIGNLENLNTDKKDDLVTAINSLCLSYDETMAILTGLKTVTVTLSANDGASLEGQTVTMLNVATGEEITKEYDPVGISFEIYEDIEYCLRVSDMEDYTTPEPVKILVTRGKDLEVQLEYKHLSFNDHSWARIAEIVESGRASEIFSLHDEKEVELDTGEKIVLEIADFNHDILASDTEKTAGITLAMKDCLITAYAMNTTDTNVGGWAESKMRTVHIRENLYDVLPEDLKAVIKKVIKKTSAGNLSLRIVTTEDDVWMFSIVELGLTGSEPISEEGTAYPIFSGQSKIKHRGPDGEAMSYYTRSPFPSGGKQFEYIYAGGYSSFESASTPLGMVAGLCI